MKTRAAIAAAACGSAFLALAGAGSALGAEPLRVTEAAGAQFPARSFVLSLPDRRSLAGEQVHVEENGDPVPGVEIVPADQARGRGFGVVLAIDSSQSMHGDAILGAMDAARAFAGRRPANQSVGVVFFNREADVALRPTTDGSRLLQTLSQPPSLEKGTRLNDATAAAIDLLRDSRVSAGSVVVLSDGADVGSARTTAEVAAAARRAHVRIFSVGLRSPSYDAATLRELADAGAGSYAEASSPAALRGVFDTLADRLAAEYLVTYRSGAPAASRIEVSMSVDGIAGAAIAAYDAPALDLPAVAATAGKVGPRSGLALVLVSIVCAALIGFALWLAIRPRRASVRERIEGFVGPSGSTLPAPPSSRQAAAMFAGAERSLSRTKWWAGFVQDVDVAGYSAAPLQIALTTTGGALAGAWLFWAGADRPFTAVLILVVVPFVVRRVVAAKAERQRRAFAEQLVDNLQVIISAMRAGHSFVGALSVAVDDASEPARRELRRIVRDEQLGMSVEDAVEAVARRMRSRELEHVGLVAALQRETGGNTAEVLDRLIENVRSRIEVRRLVRTLTAQGRLGGAIVSALPLVMVVLLNIMNPGFSDPMLESGMGRLIMAAGAMAIVTGWLIIRRVVDIKV